MMVNLKKNMLYQVVYQVFASVLPLITSPYLSRVLGASGLGIFSYTSTFVAFFSLFAMIGVQNYGTRCISSVNERSEEKRIFWEIYIIQIITSLIAIVLYILTLIYFIKENNVIYSIHLFIIIGCAFDVKWYLYGKEEFRAIVMRDTAVKILTIACIFIFVKSAQDLWKYALIMALGIFGSQIYIWILVIKRVGIQLISLKMVGVHLKPDIMLFIPIVALQIYPLIDKTMIGMLSPDTESGFYYNADKLVYILFGITRCFGDVTLPRISSLKTSGRNSESQKLIGQSIEGLICIACAMAFGIISISNEFVPIFFGDGYEECIYLLRILSFVIVFVTISYTIRMQYLIPYQKENIFIITVIIGIVVNLIINYILIGIYNMGAMGAAIGTLIAEALICLIQLIVLEKQMCVFKKIVNSAIYFLFGILMYILIRWISLINIQDVIRICIEVLCGVIIYTICCVSYWKISKNSLLNLFNVFNKKKF